MEDLEFVECPECASKPGSPTLCDSCLKNRNSISKLKQELENRLKQQDSIEKPILQTELNVHTWFRKSTNEWIGEINYQTPVTDGIARFTGATEREAFNAAAAEIGHCLLNARDEIQKIQFEEKFKNLYEGERQC